MKQPCSDFDSADLHAHDEVLPYAVTVISRVASLSASNPATPEPMLIFTASHHIHADCARSVERLWHVKSSEASMKRTGSMALER